MAMSKWILEEDPVIRRRVGKTGEEVSELSKVCFRISLQGINGVDPATGTPNKDALIKEVADVLAQCECTIEALGLPRDVIAARVAEKKAQMAEWEGLYP